MRLIPDTDPNPVQADELIHHTDPGSAQRIADHLSYHFTSIPKQQDIVFVCIGTDRSTGDSLGPLIGSRLKKYSFTDIHLYGTLDHPVHALNLSETIDDLHRDYSCPYIVAIDACLGQLSSVGGVKIANGPLKPGAGVNKELPTIGDMNITGIVNVGGFMEYFVLQNTRLSLVMSLAETIAKGIYISLIQTNRLAVFSSLPSFVKQD